MKVYILEKQNWNFAKGQVDMLRVSWQPILRSPLEDMSGTTMRVDAPDSCFWSCIVFTLAPGEETEISPSSNGKPAVLWSWGLTDHQNWIASWATDHFWRGLLQGSVKRNSNHSFLSSLPWSFQSLYILTHFPLIIFPFSLPSCLFPSSFFCFDHDSTKSLLCVVYLKKSLMNCHTWIW